MKNELKRLKGTLKTEQYVLMGFGMIFWICILSQIMDIVEMAKKSPSAFTVVQEQEENLVNSQQYYRLYIDGECYGDVDYNTFFRVDSDGNTDFRYNVILQKTVSCVRILIIEGIFLTLISALVLITSGNEAPFTIKIVRRLRVMACLNIALAVLPGLVNIMMSMIRYEYFSGRFSEQFFYILAIGVTFGIISEIFRYGYVLQEDMDQIA